VHWLVGFTYLLLIPTLGITTFYISRKIKAAQKRIVIETAELAGSTTETLRNVELVKSLGLEQQETNRLNDANVRILGFELAKIKLIRTLSFIQGTLINLARSALMLLMLWLISKGEISLGEFFTLLFYSFAIFTPLYEFSNVASNFQEARASLENLETVLNSKPERKAVSEKDISSLDSVRFQNVGFTYGAANVQAVNDITLDLAPGKTVAFVGPSGAGKTTLVKLLVGLYQPVAGKILINTIDSKEVNYSSYKKHLGYVSQETQLFSGTIRDNLRFVQPNATDDECLEALRQASALPIIERGGKGLETRIGESGIKVSGGERQRLAIARALLRNPGLIIFDEETSSLDSLTEKEITKTIQEVARARRRLMTVLIAHRLSTVAHADTIYVLEKGKIVEQGTHSELLKARGLYAALWREQSAGGEA
jgi:ATP-binding cassette subfamily B protein